MSNTHTTKERAKLQEEADTLGARLEEVNRQLTIIDSAPYPPQEGVIFMEEDPEKATYYIVGNYTERTGVYDDELVVEECCVYCTAITVGIQPSDWFEQTVTAKHTDVEWADICRLPTRTRDQMDEAITKAYTQVHALIGQA